MSQHNKAPKAHLTTVAVFPKNYFLENLAVRSDNSILITAMNHGELWYVPAADGDEQVAPMLLHKFDMLTMGLPRPSPMSSSCWPVTSTPPMSQSSTRSI